MADETESTDAGEGRRQAGQNSDVPSTPRAGEPAETTNEPEAEDDAGFGSAHDDHDKDGSEDQRPLTNLELRGFREIQEVVASATSIFEAIRKQQQRISEVLDPARLRMIQEQQRIADLFSEQRRRLTRLLEPSGLRVIRQQQALADLLDGAALESLRDSQMRIAKIAASASVQAINQGQAEWKASGAFEQVISSAEFYNTYLGQVRAITEAVSRAQITPAWQTAIAELRSSTEIRRWAGAVSNALEGQASSDTEVQDATEELAGSPVVEAALQRAAEADTAPLDGLIEVSARALEEVSRGPSEEPAAEPPVSDSDAETYRALLKLWGAGNVVALFIIAALVSGQPFVLLAGIAAIAQISGYSVKDLIEFLQRRDDE